MPEVSCLLLNDFPTVPNVVNCHVMVGVYIGRRIDVLYFGASPLALWCKWTNANWLTPVHLHQRAIETSPKYNSADPSQRR